MLYTSLHSWRPKPLTLILPLNEIAAQAIPLSEITKVRGLLKLGLTLQGKWSEFPREVSSSDPHLYWNEKKKITFKGTSKEF